MANPEHLKLLEQGVDVWNAWRKKEPSVRPNLREANLSGVNLRRVNLREANLARANLVRARLDGAYLTGATLPEANLRKADLSGADLDGADLRRADLIRADLVKARLGGADLAGTNLREANLSGADLIGADLRGALLVHTNLHGAIISGCRIYGASVWGAKLSKGTQQRDLVITPTDEPEVAVDNIEVAQFVYLLLHNEKIRDVIDTIGRKGVLLLGRFTEGRIAVLERLREELRKRGYLPIVFNFDKPETKDFTETIRLLAANS